MAHENTIGPAMMQRGNESPQQTAQRLCQPKVSTFSRVAFPNRYVRFPDEKSVLGESIVSESGFSEQ